MGLEHTLKIGTYIVPITEETNDRLMNTTRSWTKPNEKGPFLAHHSSTGVAAVLGCLSFGPFSSQCQEEGSCASIGMLLLHGLKCRNPISFGPQIIWSTGVEGKVTSLCLTNSWSTSGIVWGHLTVPTHPYRFCLRHQFKNLAQMICQQLLQTSWF